MNTLLAIIQHIEYVIYSFGLLLLLLSIIGNFQSKFFHVELSAIQRAGVSALGLLAFLVGLAPHLIPASITPIDIPSGAVVTFNDNECPDGWSTFSNAAGRVIVGVGSSDGLSRRYLLEQGGQEVTVVSVENMPTHQHLVPVALATAHYGEGPSAYSLFGKSSGSHNQAKSSPVGMGEPITNMQPFIALLYCTKN